SGSFIHARSTTSARWEFRTSISDRTKATSPTWPRHSRRSMGTSKRWSATSDRVNDPAVRGSVTSRIARTVRSIWSEKWSRRSKTLPLRRLRSDRRSPAQKDLVGSDKHVDNLQSALEIGGAGGSNQESSSDRSRRVHRPPPDNVPCETRLPGL